MEADHEGAVTTKKPSSGFHPSILLSHFTVSKQQLPFDARTALGRSFFRPTCTPALLFIVLSRPVNRKRVIEPNGVPMWPILLLT